ncbi:MAG: hypothetical protein Q4C98_09375 [Capnocytophaga sp.]|nr:hypothetical protein [Capnocytophaga sp.]
MNIVAMTMSIVRESEVVKYANEALVPLSIVHESEVCLSKR